MLTLVGLLLVILIATTAFTLAGASLNGFGVTFEEINWTFADDANPVGISRLVRHNKGFEASFSTSDLLADQAMTLWFIVFNYPDLCSDGECGVNDLGDTPAQGDFHYASGQVIDDDGNASYRGRLRVGDLSGSGLIEMACPVTQDCGIPLMKPESALVILALHSHGPALEGEELVEQLTTFSGGCEVFQDPENDGFANDRGDIPDDYGECSTMQVSPHAPGG